MDHPTILSVNGIPVFIRRLPFGDTTVWHPFNRAVGEVVEAICRGHGRWDGQYNNWIVFPQFADEVVSALRRAAGGDHV